MGNSVVIVSLGMFLAVAFLVALADWITDP